MIKKLYGIVFLASFALLINCMEEELDQENRQQPLRWHILESWNNLTTIRNFQEYIDKDEDEGAIIQWITINKDTIQNDLPALLEIASFFKKQSVVAHIL